MAPTGHCHRWAGTEGERWVAAGRASGLVGLGLQWGLGRQQIAWLKGRPARLWQEQEGVRGGAIFLYGDVIYSGGKKFRQALKSHAFQALVPLLFHLADTCPEVVMPLNWETHSGLGRRPGWPRHRWNPPVNDSRTPAGLGE
ncbi:maestro heat-like repeat family member 5 [Bos indicus x Bos taurus]|uniref:maestro heat-like repeat family member 5 n=1 Tax=Bos indicus x Bos taurus TaxID=30522 RepID=UPI000F7D5481|nr:maestro heat-like repeat family member 5 [Bos indicus x Bos taurus]